MIDKNFVNEFHKLRTSLGNKFGEGMYEITLIDVEVEMVLDKYGILYIDTSKVPEEDSYLILGEYEIGEPGDINDVGYIYWDNLCLYEGNLCFFMYSGRHDNACSLTIFSNIKSNTYSAAILKALKLKGEN